MSLPEIVTYRFISTSDDSIAEACRFILDRLGTGPDDSDIVDEVVANTASVMRRHINAVTLTEQTGGLIAVDLPVRVIGYYGLGVALSSAKLAFALREILEPLLLEESRRWHEVALAICRSIPCHIK